MVVNSHGEIVGHTEENIRYYKAKKLNSRINDMNFAKLQYKLCAGREDLKAFWAIIDALDENNMFSNPSTIAKSIGWDTPRLSKFIKHGTELDAWKRIERGKYLFNPFLMKGRKVKENTIIAMQKAYPEMNKGDKDDDT